MEAFIRRAVQLGFHCTGDHTAQQLAEDADERLVGWLEFNGSFSTKRLFSAIMSYNLLYKGC